MNPLLSLTPVRRSAADFVASHANAPLASDIEQTVGEFADSEHGLRDASRLDTRTQDVLVRRHIAGVGHSINRVEIAAIDV